MCFSDLWALLCVLRNLKILERNCRSLTYIHCAPCPGSEDLGLPATLRNESPPACSVCSGHTSPPPASQGTSCLCRESQDFRGRTLPLAAFTAPCLVPGQPDECRLPACGDSDTRAVCVLGSESLLYQVAASAHDLGSWVPTWALNARTRQRRASLSWRPAHRSREALHRHLRLIAGGLSKGERP